MQNFDFYNPTHVVFGEGTIARLDELVPADARVLVLYGGGSAERNGTLAEVQAALARRHNLQALLLVLHVNASESEDEGLRTSLLPAVTASLRLLAA